MILKMEKLSAFGLLDDKDAVIRALMKKACVQLNPPDSVEEFEELQKLMESGSADVYALEQKQSRYAAALSAISPYSAKSGFFSKKEEVSYDSLENGEMIERAEKLCSEIERIAAEISELRTAKSKDQFLVASLEPWAGMELPLETSSTRTSSISFYLLPGRLDNEALEAKCQELAPASCLYVASKDREQQYIATACHKYQENDLWEALKEFGASRITFPGLTGTARENIQAASGRIAEVDAQIAKLENELRELGKDTYPLKFAVDSTGVDIQRGRAGSEFMNTRETFFFSGWVPETRKEETVKILDEYNCYYEFAPCGEEEEAPILLKNNKWVAPFESITEMYSPPAYHGIDPNPFLAPFFFIFFGMMLSDAAYGLLLVFGGLLMIKLKGIKPGDGKLLKVIILGGVSTVIWGAIYGSWFGDIIQVVAETFFGRTITIPQLIDPMTQATFVMILSMGMGLVHIMLGMGLQAYLMIKRGHPWQALFDVGFWYFVLIGVLFIIFEPTRTFGIGLAGAGVVGLVLTQGRDKKNIFMKLASGVLSLYDITGFLSDILSYTRILALGLATGVIATVVNAMGAVSGTFSGAIILLVVFVFGHALNLAINALGSYVHTSRLQYIEFFGRFYESGGQIFAPLAASTEYVTVINKEEM